MPNKLIEKKIKNKRNQLAKQVEIAAEEWQSGNNQKLLNLSQEMDSLFMEYYNTVKVKQQRVIPVFDIDDTSIKKSDISIWIKILKINGKKIYECWVDEFGHKTHLGNFFKRTSKWSGGGAQDTGFKYITNKYPLINNIQLIEHNSENDKLTTTWKKIKYPFNFDNENNSEPRV